MTDNKATKSFVTTARFYDDKNYPRGFSRHGDYTINESNILENHGQAFIELELGKREATTQDEKDFLAVCHSEKEAVTPFEKAWQKYRARITNVKRVYTLSGLDNSGDSDEDYGDDE